MQNDEETEENKATDEHDLLASLPNLELNGQKIDVDLPLLTEVYRLNAEIAKKFPASFDNGFGQMGLLLMPKMENYDYWCTPVNSICFGHTGGGGTHFNFLITDNKITEQTPVVLTAPDFFSNKILARNFQDFIRLGLHCGYFMMEYFGDTDRLPQMIKHYSRTDWDNIEEWFPDKNHRRVAEYVANALNLERLIYTQEEFEQLQVDFADQIIWKDENDM